MYSAQAEKRIRRARLYDGAGGRSGGREEWRPSFPRRKRRLCVFLTLDKGINSISCGWIGAVDLDPRQGTAPARSLTFCFVPLLTRGYNPARQQGVAVFQNEISRPLT